MNVKNRKCIQRLSWRSLWASRNRNIIAIIAIALTTLMFTSLFTIALSMNSSYESYSFRQAGGYGHGTFKNVNDEQIKQISEHSNIKATGKRVLAGFIFSGKFEKTPAEISYMDDNNIEWSYATPVVGHNPKDEKDITMDTKALELLGIEPETGAKIELTYTVGFEPDTSYEKTDTFTLSGWWEYDNICPAHYINLSEEYVKKIEAEAIAKGQPTFSIDLNVMTSSSINIEGKLDKVAQDLKLAGRSDSLTYGVNWGYTASQLDNSVDMTVVLAIIAFIALVTFTGYLIIYNIFQISVTGDIRFYGLLKTIGVTPKQLSRIIRQQALLLCAIGIPTGLLVGFVVGTVLTPTILSQTTLDSTVSTVSTSPVIFAVSTLFSLVTVLLSCYRPGKIAGKVSPVEATKYTEVANSKKKCRATRGAKIHQMAFANLGRHKSKTLLVVISLSLSVVLFNLLVTFTSGFDMEKYLAKQSCADFIVSSTDYFTEPSLVKNYITEDQIAKVKAHTRQSLSGCGYTLIGNADPTVYISEEEWLKGLPEGFKQEDINLLNGRKNEDGMIEEIALIEGLDTSLFKKLTVVEGDITPVLKGENNAIAMVAYTDDYGNLIGTEHFPKIGSVQTINYIKEAYVIDSRTGEKANDTTPVEFLESYVAEGESVDYTICAYVTVPFSMSHRYKLTGYSYVLPIEKLKADSQQEVAPMFYLFDTTNKADEDLAESYLAELTLGEGSELMYNSKATIRNDFKSFQSLFLLMGGLLCVVIAVVGILNFFNAIMTGILSRKREFAVLQAVGMTNKQLRAMLVYEGLFYALNSAFIALILSLLFNPLVSVLLEKMFWFFSPNFTIVPVLIVVPVFALLGWLIPYILYNQASKHSVVERLREN
ncbi:MAG: ABC transporter permease [Acutalibacteraceae bacterium]|nr:ABC transporter permease [Acutalibacteraceae bacterium]